MPCIRVRTSTQPPPPPYTSALTLISCGRHGVECTQTRLCLSTMSLAARISEGLCAPLVPTCLGCAHRSLRSNHVVSRGTGRLGHRQRCDSPASRSSSTVYGLWRSRPPPWRRSDGSTSRMPSAPQDVLWAVVVADRLGPGTRLERH
jgi:hypothetical protein